MEVAVLGGGHGCYATAADLSERGHRVRFWRRDEASFAPVLDSGGVMLRDHQGVREVKIAMPTLSLTEAIKSADVIIIPLPATTHESLAEAIAPHLEDGQVIFLPPGTFGSYLFLKAMRAAGNDANVSFAETGTLPYLARMHGDRKIVISAYAKHLPTGVFPARNAGQAIARLKALYCSVEGIEDCLSAALMNAGPIIHPPLIMMNAGPLEHFARWDIHNEGTQASIRRVTDALDAERIAIRVALGYGAPHYPLADHYADDGAEWMYGRASHDRLIASGDWRESIDLANHRYMTEDTKLGLAFLVSVGRWAGVATPLAEGFLAIASAITGQDLYAQGRTLEALGLADLDRNQMAVFLRQGL